MVKLSKSKIKENLKKQAAEQATPPGGYVSGRTPEERMQNELRRLKGDSPLNTDFSDIPLTWLKQELSVANKILAKLTYYSPEERVKAMLSGFFGKYTLPSGTFYMDDVLSRISEIIKKFENLSLIYDVAYGEPEMQHTTVLFFVNVDRLRIYKTALIKEIQLQEGNSELTGEGKDVLKNGKLTYNIDNREVQYGGNKPLLMSPTSDYGRLLILLMSNLDKRVSYTQICDAVNIDYKTEKLDPETDLSIKRQIQQIKKDLVDRLKKAEVPQDVLKELIVARSGYKMNKID